MLLHHFDFVLKLLPKRPFFTHVKMNSLSSKFQNVLFDIACIPNIHYNYKSISLNAKIK